jgi:general secretion pathway protein I
MRDAEARHSGQTVTRAARVGEASPCARTGDMRAGTDLHVTRASRPCGRRSAEVDGARPQCLNDSGHGRDARVTLHCVQLSRRQPRRLDARPAAFTLVEVLAALLLVAIVVPVVMQGVSLATGAASAAKRRTEAASLAQSKMAELLATRRWQGGALSGRFDADDGHNAGDYGWRAEVTPSTEPYVKELAVRVTWDRNDGEQSVTLTTLVYEGRPDDDEDDEETDDYEGDAASGAAGGAP